MLIGVGEAHRVDADEVEPVGALDLMIEAARSAVADAAPSSGVSALGARVGLVAVPVGTWEHPDPGCVVADALGATNARTLRAEVGVGQITPLRVAAERIRAGQLDAVVVVGGEARASAARAARAGTDVPAVAGSPAAAGAAVARGRDGIDVACDEVWAPEGEFMAPAEITAGMWDPVVQYAAIERAVGARHGRTLDELRDDVAGLWAGFNQVAVANPLAAFPTPRDAAFLRAPGPGNRPLADPYAKWHSTQWTVDQAAAVVCCSAELARDLGVPADRWVVPHVLVDSSHAVSLSRRSELDRWPAMQVLGAAAAAHVGRPLDQVDHVELYSCFPSAVRVQQRELALDGLRVPTLTGGMAFAGGPFNNFTHQAVVAMVRRLRAEPGSLGLVTSVSGLLTKPGLSVWSTSPAGPPLLADLGAAAARVSPAVGATAEWTGDATVLTGTVSHLHGTPTAFVIADAAPSLRWVGSSTDAEVVDLVGSDDLVGSVIRVEGDQIRGVSSRPSLSPRYIS